jgi:tetratricopeptide (TPR) repeat protein
MMTTGADAAPGPVGDFGWAVPANDPRQWASVSRIPLAGPGHGIDADRAVASIIPGPCAVEDGLLYQRPTFSGLEAVYSDLTAYAPGLNTTLPDIRAVVEAEAQPDPRNALGRIDPAARRLVERARSAGWQAVTVTLSGAGAGRPGATFTVVLNGRGHFAYERTLPCGLREGVSCDGSMLLHLYPELGLGARRQFSRFHLAELAHLIPWVLPSADDLARGADVKWLDNRTVAVVPTAARLSGSQDGGPLLQVHLLFGPDGRLLGRKLVEAAGGQVRFEERYAADGTCRLLDGRGQTVATRRLTVTPGKEPQLRPDSHDVLVLPLPFRTPAFLLNIDPSPWKNADEKDLLLLSAYHGMRQREDVEKMCVRYSSRTKPFLGLYTLLMANGIDVGLGSQHPVLAAHRRAPAALYLGTLRPRKEWPEAGWGDLAPDAWPLLHRLLALQALDLHPRDKQHSRAQVERALAAIRQGPPDAVVWAMLVLLWERTDGTRQTDRAVVETFRRFEGIPGLRYAARYEHARGLLLSRKRPEAAKEFLDLYQATLARGALPPIDASFAVALSGDAHTPDAWAPLVRRTGARLVAERHRLAGVALAWQCREVGDSLLADRVLDRALGGMTDPSERLDVTLAAVTYLWRSDQPHRAGRLLDGLLAESKPGHRASLWRLAAAVASERRLPGRALACLERALDLESREFPKLIDLNAVRADYGRLLNGYLRLTDALAVTDQARPAELPERVVRAVDHWRTLDPDNPVICPLAARILYRLHAHELAWEYLNTPTAVFPPDADSWKEFAEALLRHEDFQLAELAYAQAERADPSDAGLVWARAQTLERAGRRDDALAVYRRLVEGHWAPVFRAVQEQARRRLGER